MKATIQNKGIRNLIATGALALVLGVFSVGCATTGGSSSSMSPEEMTALQAQADSGNGDALVKLGDAYANGDGVTKDPVKAKEYYEKAKAAYMK